MVDERMLEHVAGSIATSAPSATVYSLLVYSDLVLRRHRAHSDFLRAEQLEQVREVVFLPCFPQLLDLPESVRFDLKLNGVLWCVLYQCVTRLEFEIAGNINECDTRVLGTSEPDDLPTSI